MVKIIATDMNGDTTEIDGKAGTSLMEALSGAGVEGIEAICGGGCSCATCHVHIDPAWMDKVGPRGDIEEQLVSATDAFDEAVSRLSCQVELSDALDGLVVTAQEAE